MSFDDWLLSLHVLSAFAYVAALVVFWVMILAVRKADTPEATIRLEPASKVGAIAVGVGAVGTLVFGIWLAITLDRYQLWDGWIIAAFILWIAAAAVGDRAGKTYQEGMKKARELDGAGQTAPNAELLALNRTQRGLMFHTFSSVVAVLLLIDMIWKPGA